MFIAGAFEGFIKLAGAGSYSSFGCTQDGFILRESLHREDIKSDCGGEAPVDGIQRGKTTTVQFTYIEYDLIRAILNAMQGGTGSAGAVGANVGKLVSALSFSLAIVPVPDTPAETHIGAGNAYIFHRCKVDGEVLTLLSSQHRKGPLTLMTYPNGSDVVYEIASDPT